ncbi:MAG: histidine phosphatase family protein [Candidatus Thermoplasmatota archaeon]|nr:histidine phosphatase family protein [Candidatus Thermoplasmatota archaeon]
MTRARLYLARHAQAAKHPDQEDDHLFSTQDAGLSPQGATQASELARLVGDQPIEAVYASPAARAVETAEVLAAPHGLAVNVDPRLAELPVAGPDARYKDHLENIHALARALAKGQDPEMAHGNRFSEETARFREAIQEALDTNEVVLVVAHGLQNRAYLAHAMGLDPARMVDLEQDHACLNMLETRGDRTVALKLNITIPALMTEGASLEALRT